MSNFLKTYESNHLKSNNDLSYFGKRIFIELKKTRKSLDKIILYHYYHYVMCIKLLISYDFVILV